MFRRRRPAAGPDRDDASAADATWPLLLGILLRLAAWAATPGDRLASDEESYFAVAAALVDRGEQDLFWPPLTGWLIAAVRLLLASDAPSAVRLAWVGFDCACLVAVGRLARRTADALPIDAGAARRLVAIATAGYAVYLPAISHAQFATSEIPSLLLVLLALMMLGRPGAGSFGAAGALTGAAGLARSSLLPIAALLPLAAVWPPRNRAAWRRVSVFAAAAALVVGGMMTRNWLAVGRLVLSDNSAYNFYIGNRELYGEDLNLLHPRATPEQIEFRRQMWAGTLAYPSAPPHELVGRALTWIRDHPAAFAGRAAGRLARVFVPRTDVLELVGGERRAGVFAPAAMTVLGVAAVQWALVLAGGLVGLAGLSHLAPREGRLHAAVMAGTLLPCLVAIAKPRYSFPFDPLLIIGAAALATAPRVVLHALTPRDRRWLVAAGAFVAWGWAAWGIFAWTSRTAA